MESKEKQLNKKNKRKIFNRRDRFLLKDFGQDIAKKVKTMTNYQNSSNLTIQNHQKTEEIMLKNPDEPEKILKNKRYEIKYSDARVETFINGLKLASQEAFLGAPRKICPLCKRNSSLFCPECIIPVINEALVPKVVLPFQLTM